MKKNIYRNIEDLVVRIRMVTPQGTMERNILVSEWCYIHVHVHDSSRLSLIWMELLISTFPHDCVDSNGTILIYSCMYKWEHIDLQCVHVHVVEMLSA